MPLTATSLRHDTSSKAFLELLVNRHNLKPGFRQVLAGKNLEEIDRYLQEKDLLSADSRSQAFAQLFQLPFIRLLDRPIQPSVLGLIPADVAKRYKVVAYDVEKNNVYLAVGQPARLQQAAPIVLTRLRQQKGLRIHLAIAPESDVDAILDKLAERLKTPAAPSVPSPPAPSHPVTPPLPLSSHELSQPPAASISTPPVAPASPPAAPKPPIPPPPPPAPEPPVPEGEGHAVNKSLNKQDLIKEVDPRRKFIDLKTQTIPTAVLNRIPFAVAKKYRLIVFGIGEQKSQYEPQLIKVAVVDPDDPHVKEILAYIEQRNKILVDWYQMDEESFRAGLNQYEQAGDEPAAPTAHLVEEKAAAPEPPTIKAAPSPPAARTEPTNQNSNREEKTITIEDDTDDLKTETKDGAQNVVKNADRVLPGEAAHPAPALADEPKKAPSAASDLVAAPEEGLTLAADDIINRPSAEQSIDELQRLAKEQQNSLEDQNLDKLLRAPITSPEDLAKAYKTGFIPEIVAATLFLAIQMKASDVHVEAEMDSVRIRYRIDGILHDVIKVPHFLHAPLISRIKILSKMKIDEQRVPQDGRFDVIIASRQVDLRVSTLPTVHGEKIVMRLLDKSEGILSLEKMGVTGANFDVLVANIIKPYGIILSTGPTGSGKSTTLYAILSRLSKPGVNIITLEDPVEYEIDGINQAQVKPQIGFTFAEGLRSVLRQDPNIIMVGEIRDLETAAMSTHAALTGHLVLSTLHTNDSAGALPRLINMGVEPFLITSSLNAVIGQRLVRRVCDNCREKVAIPPAVLKFVQAELAEVPSGQLKNIDMEQLVFYHGKGCAQCTNGYRGRIGIFEVLSMSEAIEELAVRKEPASEIKKQAIKEGMVTMTQDGLIKALKGITTIDEVMRVTTTQIKEVPGN